MATRNQLIVRGIIRDRGGADVRGRGSVRFHSAERSLAGLLIAKLARRRGEIATRTAGSGPELMSTAVIATLPVTARGHPGNLGLNAHRNAMPEFCVRAKPGENVEPLAVGGAFETP